MRRGLETLNITEARWKEMGLPGFAAPIKACPAPTTTATTRAYMQQWDGTKWVKVSDWIAPMKDKVRPLLEAAAQGLRDQERRLAEAHGGLRQGVLSLRQPAPRGGRRRLAVGSS